MNANANEIELITASGLYLKSGETFLMAFNKDEILVYSHQIKHLATPNDDNNAATKITGRSNRKANSKTCSI